MIRFALLGTCMACLMSACGGGVGAVMAPGDQVEFPEVALVTDVADTGPGETLTFEDSKAELPQPDLAPACRPGEGCFLDPCSDNGDCLSGWCVEHMGNQVCSMHCVEECPEGWICQDVGSGPDLIYVCVSPHSALCKPCSSSDDCTSATAAAVCVDYGASGKFCGSFCDDTQICPAQFVCEDAFNAEGAPVTQCGPKDGECPCSQSSAKLGLTTPCYVENDWGKCTGQRACGPAGLSDCDAKTPTQEICNGLDDDCNGQVDDLECSDGMPCTADSCQGEDGCAFEPLTDTQCSDGDACTQQDHCDAGECVAVAVDCDDLNPCTVDSCESDSGCAYTFNQNPCDDGDPCTFDDHCKEGLCVGAELPCDCVVDEDCLALSDGDLCNGTLFCDVGQFPQSCEVDPATVIVCPEPEGLGSECLVSTCQPATGQCSLVPGNEGGACNDGNWCTKGETCLEGVCQGGAPINCNDDDPCTTDGCEAAVGCGYLNNTVPCDDGNLCTLGDTCLDGSCEPGSGLLACDDGNMCTDDACQPGAGCLHVANTLPCDDNNSCTTEDLCLDGVCAGAGVLQCDDANPCTKDVCLPDGGCLHEEVTGACSDADPCTVNDFCVAGICTSGAALDCDDQNPCTDDQCTAQGICQHLVNAAQCDDQNPCTTGDHCEDGACVPTDGLFCDDGNVCTTDWCTPAHGCVYQANTLPCNDGNECLTGDVCSEGECAGSLIVNCDDGNVCTFDNCIPDTGCTNETNTIPCDDGNKCTLGDQCGAGVCKGHEPLECNDGDVCTDDSCDPAAGCVHVNNSSPCDDEDACTLADLCAAGVCAGTQQVQCDDGNVCTADSCDPAVGCVKEFNTALCEDGNACTKVDKCQQGMCKGTEPLDCNDNDVCTDDACNPDSGCVYEYNTSPCDDLNLCTTADACLDGICLGPVGVVCTDNDVCTDDSCLPLQGCVFALNSADCDDGNACTEPDACVDGACEGQDDTDCDDSNPCTEDSCDWVQGCQYGHSGQGGVVGLCAVCDGQGGQEPPLDDALCEVIDCDELDYHFTKGDASPTGTNYCMVRDYDDLDSGRCAELGWCKEPNGADCIDYSETELAACGPCLYATGPCQGCLPYDDETACGAGYWCQSGQCTPAALKTCKEWKNAGSGSSGNYSISPGGGAPISVYCDMTTQGGGWTRVNGLSANTINQIMGGNARQMAKCSNGSSSHLISPSFSGKNWSWSSKQAVSGTWTVNGAGKSCGSAGEFNAAGYGWGFGCSNGGGYHHKFYPGMCDNCGFPCNCGIPKGHTMAAFTVCGSHNYASYAIFVREN